MDNVMIKKFIVLIEDERSVCQMIDAHLRRAGYENRWFEAPKPALFFFEQHKDKIDLVITDLVMPGMRGTEVAERMRALNPNLPIVLMTAYHDPDIPADKTRLFSKILFKPFTKDELRDAVKTILESGTLKTWC